MPLHSRKYSAFRARLSRSQASLNCLLLGGTILVPTLHLTGQQVLTHKDAFTDYTKEHPGVARKLTVADLPEPYATRSAMNDAHLVVRPADAWPQAPPGFKVELYADGFVNGRLLRTAPNGDIFMADNLAGEVIVLRGVGPDGKAKRIKRFATDLTLPFGIAFYPAGPDPQWVYVANTDSVVRYPYRTGDMVARGAAETVIASMPGYARLHGGGHWTHDIVFSKDGKHMFVSIGSRTNVEDTDGNPADVRRADVLEYTPSGSFEKIYASGIRNCVGEAINPITGELWCSTNERDGLGDNLVPDYITHLEEDGFYGWPWFYMGGHQDPRHKGKHPELQAKVLTPDVLLQPHFASLEMLFYSGSEFPERYRERGFAAEHGSWNRESRAGYEVISFPTVNGHATGEYEDFLTGFVLPNGDVWGRPVGVTTGLDGSLFVSDDGSNSIWHITYTGTGSPKTVVGIKSSD
jgi:glucose/arabinose dehydrogenase